MEEIKKYDDICVLNVEAKQPYAWDEKVANYIRVSLPASLENRKYMQEKGYSFGDRILDVSINVVRPKLDYKKLIRIKPELISGCRDEILEIAYQGFPTDRRFHVALDYDEKIAHKILKAWVGKIPNFFVCRYRGEIVGFLALRQISTTDVSIYLAAVKERYRAAGIATSLYSGAISYAIENGFKIVNGTISSSNVAVMNLYAYLGATFSNSRDVFLKEVKI